VLIIASQNGYPGVVKLLLKAGAKMEVKSKVTESPSYWNDLEVNRIII
jgi:hypothetical protein